MARTAAREAVDAAARRLLTDHPTRGVAVGVVEDGRPIWAVHGAAGVERWRPVTPTTAFKVASITKTFVSLAVMQLVEQGRLSLDDPVNDQLRTFRVECRDRSAGPVTPRHLLTHTAGVGELHRVRDLLRPYAGFAVRPGRPVPALADLYGPVFRTEVAAGSKWAYANHGFAILGQLIEDVIGSSLRDVLVERVFDPLGMAGTDLGRGARLDDDVAVGYRPRRRLQRALDPEITVPAAGGGRSSVTDMLAYARALATDGGGVVRPATLADMVDCHFALDPRLPGRGLGFAVGEIGAYPIAGHTGGVPGFSSSLVVAPGRGAGAFVVVNSSSVRIGIDVLVTSRRLLTETLGTTYGPSPEAPGHPEVWGELTGTYVPDPGKLTNARLAYVGWRYRVRRTGDGLELRTPVGAYRGGKRLVPVDPDDPYRFEVDCVGLPSPVVFRDGRMLIADGLGLVSVRRR